MWQLGIWAHSIFLPESLSPCSEEEIRENRWDTLRQGNPMTRANASHKLAIVAWLPDGAVITRDYYDSEIKVVDQQLALAGVRLATLLNSVFREEPSAQQ